MTKKVWVFDLDNTLHNTSAYIFPEMHRAMTQYMMEELKLEASHATQLRQHYWRVYGATLKGLMRHHDVNPYHFLEKTHTFENLHEMVVGVKKLKQLLNKLPGRKCVFTNGPQRYAERVLQLMGVADCFEFVFSIESAKFHAKPSPRGFAMLLKKLKVRPRDCVMVEDNLEALKTAKTLGMTTILITKKHYKPLYVNFRLNSVLALTHIRV